MRVALRGLVTGYGLIALAWLYALKIAPHIRPNISMVSGLVLVGGPFVIVHGVALAIFGGSAVCSGRALYRETVARTVAGYVIFVVSAISAATLGILWLRGLVFAQ
jgi:hypothetical protein